MSAVLGGAVFGTPEGLAHRPRGPLVAHPDYVALAHGGRVGFLRAAALREAWTVAARYARHKPVEVAFLCMGRRAEDAIGHYTVIDQLGHLAVGTATAVQVDPRDKQSVLAAWPSLDVVGWAHSHPGFGAFLSAVDRVTCDDFGADALNLVIDPLRRELAVALGREMVALYDVPRGGLRGRSALGRWLRHEGAEVRLCPLWMSDSSAPTA